MYINCHQKDFYWMIFVGFFMTGSRLFLLAEKNQHFVFRHGSARQTIHTVMLPRRTRLKQETSVFSLKGIERPKS